jgi:DNA-binding NarL/FixJ family response regulator
MKPKSLSLPNQSRIRILVADDHPIVRDGIMANVKPQPDMIVVADAGDGLEALGLIKEYLPLWRITVLDCETPCNPLRWNDNAENQTIKFDVIEQSRKWKNQ